jgi:FecR protein
MVSTKFTALATALALCTSGLAYAAAPANKNMPAAATVEGVQLPVWVQRGPNGTRQPLAAGTVLGSQDKVLTGDNARLLLRMADGSTVKLGPKAQLNLNYVEASREDDTTVLRAVLNVAVGAFRFTTDAVSKLRTKRDVQIKFSTVTAGIRGTDVWGAQRPDREIVCLLEGNVSINRELEGANDTATLDQPLHFYIALKDKPAAPVAFNTPEQIKIWSAETEIAEGQPVLRADGKYRVVFVVADQLGEAFKTYDELRTAGYPASIQPVPRTGKHGYQVSVAGLESEVAANALKTRFPAYEQAKVVR